MSPSGGLRRECEEGIEAYQLKNRKKKRCGNTGGPQSTGADFDLTARGKKLACKFITLLT